MHTPMENGDRQELLGKCWGKGPVDDPADDWWDWS